MKLVVLMFLAALSIAAISAYFSIFGLVALFSATPIALIIAGSVTEFGKIVLVSYLYRFWNYINFIGKSIIIFVVACVMAVTSIGVFGYLSSSYLEHQAPEREYEERIERLDERIESDRQRMSRYQRALDDLDSAFEQYVERGYITRGLERREEQREDREGLESQISEIEDRIDKFNEERSELRRDIQSVEMEIGPIIYFAKAVYGDSDEAVDQAVRLLIVLLIIILDPFAVTILISANHAHVLYIRRRKEETENKSDDSNSDDENDYKESQYDQMITDTLSDEDKINKVKEFLDEKENEDSMKDSIKDSIKDNETVNESHSDINSEHENVTKTSKYTFVENDIDDDDDENNDKKPNDNCIPK